MTHPDLGSQSWQELLGRLGGAEALAVSARHHKAFCRSREIKSAADLLRLIMLYGPGGQSLRTAAALAATEGIADFSDVALMERVERSADWLKALCEERLSALRQTCASAGETTRLRLLDGSRIALPGRSEAWRLHLAYDPVTERTMEASLTQVKVGERLDLLPVSPGTLYIADRGYPHPEGLANTRKAGADVLVRLTWNSLRLVDESGKPLDWLALLARSSVEGSLDMKVRVVKARGLFEPLPLRLVILKKPEEAARKARKAATHASRKDGHETDPRTLAAAGHLILLTSRSEPVQELAGLYRLRWQIELVFKRMKSLLHLDRLPAKRPELCRAWLYAHLLFALLIEDFQAELEAFPPRRVSQSDHSPFGARQNFSPPPCWQPSGHPFL